MCLISQCVLKSDQFWTVTVPGSFKGVFHPSSHNIKVLNWDPTTFLEECLSSIFTWYQSFEPGHYRVPSRVCFIHLHTISKFWTVTLLHSFKSAFHPSSHNIKVVNGIISQVYLTPVGLLKHYSPLRTLASNTLLPHLFWCLPIACHVLIPITFRSSSTSSVCFFPFSSSFPCFFHSDGHHLFWHSCLFIHPLSMSSQSSSKWSDKFYSACPFKCSLTCLFVLLPAFFCFYGTIILITLFLLSTLKRILSEAIIQA